MLIRPFLEQMHGLGFLGFRTAFRPGSGQRDAERERESERDREREREIEGDGCRE